MIALARIQQSGELRTRITTDHWSPFTATQRVVPLATGLNGTKVTVIETMQSVSREHQSGPDVIELMTVFSACLYGARSHRNRRACVSN